MTHDQILALGLYAVVTTITPGPNNLMLMASGANFGFARTLPHMFGVTGGFALMIALVGMGVTRVFDAWPPSYTLLTVLSLAYLLYLAWRIARAAPPDQAEAVGRPLSFLQAALFQWVNPKAWAMGLSAVTIYAADRSVPAVLIVAATFGVVSMPCISLWTLLGGQVRRVLSSPFVLRLFNWIMAALLILSLLPTLINAA
ncbi:LysE family translocator [Palleronia sp. LCG004]|uniref:LysE family translocator n=1 Tax=Palleronia sp. LCG004 TaxID=3079304 RepID=UPI002941DAE7|nr:LysE family translocator [Palleronia sp. LCG004]WOI57324.1 LysE family translocator [Palleronia sp. LCG004]